MTPIRAFIAIELDDAQQRELLRLQGQLDAGTKGVRWIKPEQIHLTLKFLGNVDECCLPEICNAITGVTDQHAEFDIRLAGVGVFPQRGPVRIIWAGIDEPTGRLAALQEALDAALEPLGFAREPRDFHPHVTLARVKSPDASHAIRAAVAAATFHGGSTCVDELLLFQSVSERGGPQYTALGRHALRAVPNA